MQLSGPSALTQFLAAVLGGQTGEKQKSNEGCLGTFTTSSSRNLDNFNVAAFFHKGKNPQLAEQSDLP